MEIIVTDEKDERFINFCSSFNCLIEDHQIVLLLSNYDKIVGCTSFRVYDANSAEITTLFLNSNNHLERIAYKLIRQLEKIAIDYEFKQIRLSFDSKEDILVEIFEKLDYHFIDDKWMIKEFKSLI